MHSNKRTKYVFVYDIHFILLKPPPHSIRPRIGQRQPHSAHRVHNHDLPPIPDLLLREHIPLQPLYRCLSRRRIHDTPATDHFWWDRIMFFEKGAWEGRRRALVSWVGERGEGGEVVYRRLATRRLHFCSLFLL